MQCRNSRPEVFCEDVLENLTKYTFDRVSFLIKLLASACNFIKKMTLAQVLPCEFCEIFENTFFIEQFWWLLLIMTKTRFGI